MLAITQGFSRAIQASIERTIADHEPVEWIPASRPRTVKKRRDFDVAVEQAA